MNNMLGWDASDAKEGITFADLIGGEWYYDDIILAANGLK